MAGLVGTVGLSLIGGALSNLKGRQASLGTKLLAGKGSNILSTLAGIAGTVLTAIGNDDSKRVSAYGSAEASAGALPLSLTAALCGSHVILDMDSNSWQAMSRGEARQKWLGSWAKLRDDFNRWLALLSTLPDDLKGAELNAALARLGDHAGVLDDMTENLHPGHLSTMTPEDDSEHKALQAEHTAKLRKLFKAMTSVRSTNDLPYGVDEPIAIGKDQYVGGPLAPDLRFIQYVPDAYPEAPYIGFDGMYHIPPSVVLLPGTNMPINTDVLLTAAGSTQYLPNGTVNDAFEAAESDFWNHLVSMVGSPLLRTGLKFQGSVAMASTIVSSAALTQWGAAKQSDRSGRVALAGQWKATTRSGKVVTRTAGMWRVITFGQLPVRREVSMLQVLFSGRTRILHPTLVSPLRGPATVAPDFTSDSFLTAPQAVIVMVRVPGAGRQTTEQLLATVAAGAELDVIAVWNQIYKLQKGGASGGSSDDVGAFFPTCDRQVNVWESAVPGMGATIDAEDNIVMLEFVNPVGPNMMTSHSAKNVLYMPATARPTFSPYAQWSFGPRSYGAGTQPNPVHCIDDVVPGGVVITQFLKPGVDEAIAGPRRIIKKVQLENGGEYVDEILEFDDLKRTYANSFGLFAPSGYNAANSTSSSVPQSRIGSIQADVAGLTNEIESSLKRFWKAFNAAHPGEEEVLDTVEYFMLSDDAHGRLDKNGNPSKRMLFDQVVKFATDNPHWMIFGMGK